MKRFWHISTVVVAVLAALLIANTVGVAQDEGAAEPIDIEKFMMQAQEFYEQGDFKQAMVVADQMIQADQVFWPAIIIKGECLLKLENFQAASQVFARAINLNANAAAAYNGRGEAQLELGFHDLARTDFETAVELDRGSARILSNIGHMKANFFSDPEGALRDLEDALEMNDADARAHRDMGIAHAQLREFEEAVESLENAAEIEPENYENYSTMASIFNLQEEYDQAAEALTKAIEAYEPKRRSEPDIFVQGYLLRSQARMELADSVRTDDQQRSNEAYEQVIDDAEVIIEEFGDRYPEAGSAYYLKGLAERMLGRFGEAIESLTESIQTIPPGAPSNYVSDSYLRRGICWHNQGYGDLARKDFDRSITVNFESPLPHFWTGLTYAAERDYRKAIEHYSKAVAKREDYALAYVNRGLAYYQLADYEKAVDNFNEAISHEPLEAEHYFKRGMAHLRLGQVEKAVTSFADCLRKDPDHEAARRNMSEAQQRLGNTNLAPLYGE